MDDLKTGDLGWCFDTDCEEWYGAYSTHWIMLKPVLIESWMLDNIQDSNMYFKTKELAIESMIKRLNEL